MIKPRFLNLKTERLLTVRDLARSMNLSESYIYEAVRLKALRATRFKSNIRFRPEQARKLTRDQIRQALTRARAKLRSKAAWTNQPPSSSATT